MSHVCNVRCYSFWLCKMYQLKNTILLFSISHIEQKISISNQLITFSHSTSDGVTEQYAKIDWDELGYSAVPTDYMYVMKCSKGENFSQGKLIPYGNLELSPSSGVLNYGQVKKKIVLISVASKHVELVNQFLLRGVTAGIIRRPQSISKRRWRCSDI